MKLKISERGQKFINEVLVIEPFTAGCPKHCSDSKISSLLHDWGKELYNNEFLKLVEKEYKFFCDITKVYEDGRQCPGPDRIAVVKKLTNNEWRTNMDIVILGLKYGQIELEEKDLHRISP